MFRNKNLYKFTISFINLHNVLLLGIILIAIFLRFYNIPFRYPFGEDSIRDALIAFQGARELQLPLTGSFSSLGPFTFGPWYYFHLIIFSLLIRLEYAPWVFMGICSVLFVLVVYKIGEYLEGKKFGLLVSSLSAVAISQVGTVDLSNPNLVPIYSALAILILIKILRNKVSLWWTYLLGIVIGIGINIHYQAFGLLIIPFILFLKKEKRAVNFFSAIIGIFTAFIPLILFDLNNHWYNLKNLVYYYTVGKNAIYVANRWLFYLRDFWPSHLSEFFGVSPKLGPLLSISIFVSVVIALFKRKVNKQLFYLSLIFIFNFVLLRYYWGQRSFYHLLYLQPYILILIGYFFWLCMRFGKISRYVAIFLFILFLAFMFNNSLRLLKSNSLNIHARKQASVLLDLYPNRKFALYNCVLNYKFRTESVSYLLALKNKIDDNGFKIGFIDDKCSYPPTSKLSSLQATASAQILNETYPRIKNTEAFDMSRALNSSLETLGWGPISPKIIYDSTLRWWFNEKP